MKYLKLIFCTKLNYSFKFIIISMLLFCINSYNGISKDENTPYTLKAGGFLNSNFYFSNFTQLKSYPSCCQNFDFAFGLGYSGFIGIDYSFSDIFFGIQTSADILFSFQNISANYNIEEKFANIITESSYVDAIAEHKLEPKIDLILFEPGINILPFVNIPLSFRLGLQAGVPLGFTFIQEEKIISPNWIKYKETNTNTKYHYEGVVPNSAKYYLGVSLSTKYKFIELTQNLSISPVLAFNYGLTNLSDDLDWKYSSLQAGISLEYKIPKPKNIPPADAPLPKFPIPLQPKLLTFDLAIITDSTSIDNNSVVYVPVYERQFISTNMLMPIIFYKVNSTEKLDLSNSVVREEELTQSRAYESVLNHLKHNPEVKVEIFSSSISSENIDSVKYRVNKIKDYLNSNNIDNSRITIRESIKDDSKMERKELLEDNCFIRFDFSDNKQMLTFWTDTITRHIVQDKEFEISLEAESEINQYSYLTEISFENHSVIKSIENNFSFTIDDLIKKIISENKEIEIQIHSKVKNEIFGEKTKRFSLLLKPQIVYDGVFENVISDIEQVNYVQQLVLGFCEFDQAEFSAVNNDAVKIINQSYIEGKIIEIIPLFDFLGTEEHNLKLANDRANSAIKLLNLDRDKIEINIPKDYFFSNDLPYGRMMNRAVIVRVKDLKSK